MLISSRYEVSWPRVLKGKYDKADDEALPIERYEPDQAEEVDEEEYYDGVSDHDIDIVVGGKKEECDMTESSSSEDDADNQDEDSSDYEDSEGEYGSEETESGTELAEEKLEGSDIETESE